MDSTPTNPPKKKRAKKKKTDPKEVTGTVIHAVASKVLGEHVAKTTFGNVNFNKTYLEGRVVGIEDRRKKPESPASIYIVADYTVHGRDTPKRAVIFKGGVKLGPVPADLNPKFVSPIPTLWMYVMLQPRNLQLTLQMQMVVNHCPIPMGQQHHYRGGSPRQLA